MPAEQAEVLDLDAIIARRQAAAGAPWELVSTSTLYMDGRAAFALRVEGKVGIRIGLVANRLDAEFIEASPTDVDALVKEVYRLRAQVTQLRGYLNGAGLGPV